MMSGDPEPTKAWVPILSPLLCNPKGASHKLLTLTQASRRQKAEEMSSYSDGWCLSPAQPQPFLGSSSEEAFVSSLCMQGDRTACVSSAEALGPKSWRAGLQYKPPAGNFFSSFLQGTYIRTSKHEAQDEMRCTSWSEVGWAHGPSRAMQ